MQFQPIVVSLVYIQAFRPHIKWLTEVRLYNMKKIATEPICGTFTTDV